MGNGQILGIGIDITDINRFKTLNLSKNNRFLNKIFTMTEIDYCFSKKNVASSLATKFAAKEAVIKAFNNIKEKVNDYKKIEITNDSSGAPRVKLLYANIDNYQIMLSSSNEFENAIAVVVVTLQM